MPLDLLAVALDVGVDVHVRVIIVGDGKLHSCDDFLIEGRRVDLLLHHDLAPCAHRVTDHDVLREPEHPGTASVGHEQQGVARAGQLLQ